MGASYDEIDFDGTHSESELKQHFRNHQNECAHEDGNSYSGRLNMCSGLDIQTRTFDCYQDAAAYIEEHAQKWGAAIAVRYKHAELKAQFPASVQKLSEKLVEAQEAVRKAQAVDHRAWQEKVKASKFVTCVTCKSKLSAPHIASHWSCPVCRGSLVADKSTLKLQAKADTLQAKLNDKRNEENKKAALKSKTTRWLVGGWCAS